MYVSRLSVKNLRLFESVSLSPSPGLNVICGSNGAGKTTLLEAIHIVGTGRSFRSRRLEALVRRNTDGLHVFAEIARDAGGRVGVGVGKGKEGFKARVGGERVEASSRLAQEIALALMTPESHRLLSGGPTERRRALDWGLFHMEQGYHPTLVWYESALRQRNAALRAGRGEGEVAAWQAEMTAAGDRLTEWRSKYVASLERRLQSVMAALSDASIAIRFRPGWTRGVSLEEALALSLRRDRQEGWTTVGPHRADLEFRVDGVRAEGRLSRGQSKLFVNAFELAQVKGVSEVSGKKPVVLVDDLPSELDEGSRSRFLGLLAETGSQVLVTSVEAGMVPSDSWDTCAVFHVERGTVREML